MSNSGSPTFQESCIVSQITNGLELSDDGFWQSPTKPVVSYPVAGNAVCAAIEDNSFWFRHRNRIIVAAVRRFPPADRHVFDLGGGNGFVSVGLVGAGYEPVLVEPGLFGAQMAIQRGLRHIIRATVEEAGFLPASLPAAGLFDVLEHVDDHLGFLRTLRTALRPGGRLYLTVPAFQWLWSREDEYAGHYRRYTTRTLAAALTASGFRVEYVSYFFALLVPAVFALRTAPSVLGVRRPPSERSWQQEHASGSPLTRRAAESLFGYEVGLVRRGRRLPVGTSCVCVARAG